MSRALVFPGQGSQRVGMGKEIYDAFITAKAVFQEVDETLNQNLSRPPCAHLLSRIDFARGGSRDKIRGSALQKTI